MRTSSIVLLVVMIAIAGAVGYVGITGRGFSTRGQPTRVERTLARIVHRWAIPAQAREAQNPVLFSDQVWADGRAHFADHCASCHGNDGSGQTEIGRNLFPKAPDMRLADTQNLTDGELYWIIANGVRLTGMPAWGTGGDNDIDTWKLVHFIRRLRDLTPEHVSGMESLNPKSPSELKEEQDDQRFLAGDDVNITPAPDSHHHEKE